MIGSIHLQVEYILVKFDDENKSAQVSLRAEEVLAKLNEKEAADPNGKRKKKFFISSNLISSIRLQVSNLYGVRNTELIWLKEHQESRTVVC